jgi:threonine/homoserine/homoserine lactone efflux protein
MSIVRYLPLVLFVVSATLSPGGATTLATASGVQFGVRRSVPLLAGIAIGLASMAVAAAAGLGSALLALPTLRLAMRAAGSLYLVWLAWRIARSEPPHAGRSVGRPVGFAAAVWMLWHNPKAWAMTASAAASFAMLSDSPWRLGAVLGAAFGAGALLSLSLWCLGGSLLARRLSTPAQWRIVQTALGLLVAGSILPLWRD